MPLPERPLHLLLAVSDDAARLRYRAVLDAAPFAVEVQDVATAENARDTNPLLAPDLIVVAPVGTDSALGARVAALRQRLAPSPPVLLLSRNGSPAPADMDVALACPEQTPHTLLYPIIRQLATGHRLAQALHAAAADRQHLQQEVKRLEQEYARQQQAHQQELADLSHDLRSPLNALLGYGELLREELVGREMADLAQETDRILNITRRMVGIVTDEVASRETDRLPAADTSSLALRPDHGLRTTATLLLLVDDDDDLRELMAQYLESEGFEVMTAADGEEGLRLARDRHPAAITLDVEMPGMDGWEVLARLKAHPILAQTPVVMLTGRGNEHRAARALRQGADDYLMKGTITAPAIHQAITGVLEKARQRTAR